VQAYVDLLPTPWRGFMMAGFAAAYMSTVATQLNWGASYLVNDFYRRFLRPNETQKHYVAVSRGATIVLFLLSILVTAQLNSVEKAWRVLIGLGAGTGLVYMLRWYWWRINAWSEIGAMVASGVTYSWLSGALGQFLAWLGIVGSADALTPAFVRDAAANADAVILIGTVAVTTVAWIVATFVTRPEPATVLDSFYERVRPGGPGWMRVSTRLGYGRERIPGGARAWSNWVAGLLAVYGTLFGIGKVIFGEYVAGAVLLGIAVLAFGWISRSFRSEREPEELREASPVAAD